MSDRSSLLDSSIGEIVYGDIAKKKKKLKFSLSQDYLCFTYRYNYFQYISKTFNSYKSGICLWLSVYDLFSYFYDFMQVHGCM